MGFFVWRRPKDVVFFDIEADVREPEGVACTRCDGDVFAVIATSERSKQRLVQCEFCGVSVWRRGLPKVKPHGFRFPSGRFRGLTIEEVAESENGVAYLRFVAEQGEPLGSMVQKHLDKILAASVTSE